MDEHQTKETTMFLHKDLKGRRIAVLVADGFENVELRVPVTALKAAGAHIDFISLRPGKVRGLNLDRPAGRVTVTKTVDQADPVQYDGLFIPGGFINPDLLRQSAAARNFVRAFDRDRKPIASICHGPWVLASAGLMRGRTVTSWPGIRDDMVNAGATWLDEQVVREGNWLSSRGPQDLVPFVQAMKRHFSWTHEAPAASPRNLRSSPQRDLPPQLMMTAMKWRPQPLLGVAALAMAGLAAAGWYAAMRTRSRPRTRYEAIAREPVTLPL
jgi:protease I